jgi:hypothetical protein
MAWVIAGIGNFRTKDDIFHIETNKPERKRPSRIPCFQNLIWFQNQKSAGWFCNNHLEKYEFVNGKDDPIYYGT